MGSLRGCYAGIACVAIVAVASPVHAAGVAVVPQAVADHVADHAADHLAAELKATQADVDAALKVRRQRFDAWQQAARTRDRAAAHVAKRKRLSPPTPEFQLTTGTGDALQGALQKTLALDEQAGRARVAVLAAEAELAHRGAQLLALYDALLLKRRASIDTIGYDDATRVAAISSYRELTAQRDAVRRALLPVLAGDSTTPTAGGVMPDALAPTFASQLNAQLSAAASDDVQALLEKADLARDLEERASRQADVVRGRIAELEEEQAVKRDVSGMLGRNQLFDEDDRRLLVSRQDTARSTVLPRPSKPDLNGVAVGEGIDAIGAPSLGTAPANPALLSATPPTSTPTATEERGFAGPRTDASIAGVLSSSSVSIDELRALEAKLRGDAKRLSDAGARLTAEANARARD